MKEERINGIELITRMKNNTIPVNNVIRVNRKIKDNEEIFICYIRFKDGEVEWKNNSFRLAMLIDDSYIFTIIDKQPIVDSMKQVGIEGTFTNHLMRYIDSLVYNID